MLVLLFASCNNDKSKEPSPQPEPSKTLKYITYEAELFTTSEVLNYTDFEINATSTSGLNKTEKAEDYLEITEEKQPALFKDLSRDIDTYFPKGYNGKCLIAKKVSFSSTNGNMTIKLINNFNETEPTEKMQFLVIDVQVTGTKVFSDGSTETFVSTTLNSRLHDILAVGVKRAISTITSTATVTFDF